MAKLTLTNITSGYNLPTKYNANNTATVNALENTLSRDGTSPNTMLANFDMNSYKIINLPLATTATEPLRYDQALSLISGSAINDFHVPRMLYANTAVADGGISIGRRDTGAGAWIVYSTSGDLAFYGGGSDKLTLSAAGHLGLGTASVLGSKLSVVNTAAVSTTTYGNILASIRSNASGGDVSIQFSDNTTYAGLLSYKGNVFSVAVTGTTTELTVESAQVGVRGGLNLLNNNLPPSLAGIYHGAGYVQIRGGASGTTINNNANTLVNVQFNDVGTVSFPRGGIAVGGVGSVSAFYGSPNSNVVAIIGTGGADALRMQPQAVGVGFSIAAVDNTLSAAYRPLSMHGSTIELGHSGNQDFTIDGSGYVNLHQQYIKLVHASGGYLSASAFNEIVAGVDAGGFYFATGAGGNPAIPIFMGGINTTYFSANMTGGGSYQFKLASATYAQIDATAFTTQMLHRINKAATVEATLSTYHLQFQTAGSGLMGIGTTAAGGVIQTWGSLRLNPQGNTVEFPHDVTMNTAAVSAATAGLMVKGSSTKWTVYAQSLGSGGTSWGLLIDAGSTSADQALLVRNYSGATTFLTIDGAGTLKPHYLLDLSASTAGQIKFPASQNASADANTLDDYEENTWTPTVGGTATYTVQNGRYTKIGNIVHLSGELGINVLGTGSTTQITGLPFTPSTVPANHPGSIHTILSATNVVDIRISCNAAGNINIDSKTAAASSYSANAIFQNGTTVYFQITYRV